MNSNNATIDPAARAVLEFWFGTLDDDGLARTEVAQRWWQKSDDFDAAIQREFGDLYRTACAGELAHWGSDDTNALALIILLDQFSRNLHRNTKAMVAQDATALEIAKDLITRGADRVFPAAHRTFVYLPLEHSETLHDQNQCVALFEQMRDELNGPAKEAALGWLGFAIKHQVIIERFGRFPHRNAFLDRPSTPQEIAFLKEPGSSF